MIVTLKQGLVVVGMNLPFFVPEAMVESKLRTLGLSSFRWFDRAKPFDLGRMRVTPTDDPLYTDDWNRWLEADYLGPEKNFEEKKIWSWLLLAPK
jgi:hypothetical protein